LHERFQLATHLMSNTQQLGIVVKSEYLHLSRSLFAMAGTYSGLYNDIPKQLMVTDFFKTLGMFPMMLKIDRFKVKRKTSKEKSPQSIPVPMAVNIDIQPFDSIGTSPELKPELKMNVLHDYRTPTRN
jgi:hypothetical protein